MKKIAFIIHGKLKNTDKLFTQLKDTFKGDYWLQVFSGKYKAHAIELTVNAISEGFNYIICVGGDGSLNEVANGIMQTGKNNHVYIGLLPYGTGNDFAKTLGIRTDIDNLKKCIDKDWHKNVDLGLATFKNLKGQQGQRYFINIIDVGMGGEAVERLDSYPKFWGGAINYQRAIISTLLAYRHKPIKVTCDTFTYDGRVMNFVIANGKYFGSGLGIAPDALPYDGAFAIVIIGEVSIWDYIKNLGKIRKGVKLDHPQLTYKNASEVNVTSAEGLAIDMDGEFVGYSPLHIKMVPGALKFLAPA